MKLYYQTHSPYARKVLVFAHEIEIADKIEVIHHETSPTRKNETVYNVNPLGKVPVLILPNRQTLFDSSVICDYLDSRHTKQKLIPNENPQRQNALKLQALADGLSYSGIAIRWETERRPENLRYPELGKGHTNKLITSYEYLEKDNFMDDDLHIGHIALATSLSWIEFRNLPSFREYPKLTKWYDEFIKRSSMKTTPLSGNTHD